MRVLSGGGVRLLLAGMAGVFILLGLAPVAAASANLSRSYMASEAIQNGSLVSLDPQQVDHVLLANSDNGSHLLGVALANEDSLIAVNATTGKTQVATSGSANVLVSTLGGPIKTGDEVGVSPFSGVGMKATPGSRIIGLSQTDFNEDSPGVTKQTVTDKTGQKNELFVGYVRVDISISTDGTLSKEARLNGLQHLVQGLTGRVVTTPRLVITLAIAVIALLILVTLTYSAIYSSIISIGRNPLAKYAVFRTMGAVLGMALLTATVAAISIYFLLR